MKTTTGFTLIELMIVVAIIGALAVIAVPSYSRYVAKAKRAEAYMNLSSIYAAQKSYWAENGTYGSSLSVIGWQPANEKKMHYTYAIDQAGKDAFRATATGDIDGDGRPDVLAVDEHNAIVVTQDDLA